MKIQALKEKFAARAGLATGFATGVSSLLASNAFAEAAHSADAHAHHAPGFSDLIPFWINFALFAVLVVWLMKKSFASGWPQRRDRIEKAVNASKIRLAAANERLADARGRLSQADLEIEQIVASIKRDTVRESAAVIASAKTAAERIAEQAKSTAKSELHAAESALKREMAALVIERAGAELRAKVNKQSDESYRSSALAGVGKLIQ